MRKLFVQGKAGLYRFQVGKVIGGQYLALDDGEVNIDLIEPTGVNQCIRPRMIRSSTGHRRFCEASPRCDEPLSTIQNSSSPAR